MKNDNMNSEIKEAAEKYADKKSFRVPYDGSTSFQDDKIYDCANDSFTDGALSDVAKEYWFAQFQSQQKQLSDEESAAIVKELAEWSKRYPRGITYSSSRQPKMDGELIALEERAKKWL